MTDDLKKRLSAAKEGKEVVEPLVTRKAANFKLTAGELRGAIESNPDHPQAVIYANAVKTFPDAKEVSVERVDLEAILENKSVEVRQVLEAEKDDNGQPTGNKMKVEQKVLGKPRESSVAAAGPTKDKK